MDAWSMEDAVTKARNNSGGERPRADARLSYVVATDCYETIRPVMDGLRRQTARQLIEIVLVAPTLEDVKEALDHRDEFASLSIVAVGSIDPLARARARGIRVATAPLVYIGETHAYPQPDFVEALMA